MINIAGSRIDALIAEDVPYIDLTSEVCGIGDTPGVMEYFTREDCVLAGTPFVKKMAAHFDVSVQQCRADGERIGAGQTFMTLTGPANSLLMLWKVGLNVFDRTSAIATRTRAIVDEAKAANPTCEVVTTRKSMPGAKDLQVCGIIAGGGLPHRLGLSETVLIFKEHAAFLGGFDALADALPQIKARCAEKRVFVEADAALARKLAFGADGAPLVDGLQLDKMPVEELEALVREIRAANASIKIIAAGGINERNARAYAACGVDGLATTAPFNASALDMSARLRPLE